MRASVERPGLGMQAWSGEFRWMEAAETAQPALAADLYDAASGGFLLNLSIMKI